MANISIGATQVLNEQLNGIKEEVLVSNDTLAKGASKYHSFSVKAGYRILLKINTAVSAAWNVSEVPADFPAKAYRPILQSDGNVIKVGQGSRSAAYTDVLYPIVGESRLLVTHESTSSVETLDYSIVLIKYPFGGLSGDKNPLGKNSVGFSRAGSLAVGGSEVIYSTKASTEIDFLEFATNSLLGEIRFVYPKNERYGTTTRLEQLTPDGSTVSGFQAKQIINNNSSQWVINSFEPGKYKFTFKDKLKFPNGVEVRVVNNHTDAINIGCVAYGREFY